MGFTIGAISLLCETAILIGYVSQFGLDRFSALPSVLVVVAGILLVMGGSKSPQRARSLRLLVGLLCLLSFVGLTIAAFPATTTHDSDTAGGLLFVAGLCFIVTAPCVVIVGRPRR